MNDIFFTKNILYNYLVKHNYGRRLILIILMVFATYGVNVILSIIDDVWAGHEIKSMNFSMDFAAFVQYVVTIPLLFLFEIYFRNFLNDFMEYLKQSVVVTNYDALYLKIKSIKKLNNITIFGRIGVVNICLYIISYIGVWFFTKSIIYDNIDSWHAINNKITLPGFYSIFISIPIVIFFILRLVLVCIYWCVFLFKISRSRLQIIVMHPDGYGGLGFIRYAHMQFSYLAVIVALVSNLTILYKIIIEKEDFGNFGVLGVCVLLYLSISIFYTIPLSFFSNIMVKEKRLAILGFSNYFAKHHIALLNDKKNYEQKVQKASDLIEIINSNSIYSMTYSMKIMPFDVLRNVSFQAASLFISFLPIIVEIILNH